MMKSNILVILALSLVGCQDFTIGLFGQESKSPSSSAGVSSPPAVQIANCTTDAQCQPGQICYKPDPDSYVGECAQVRVDYK